MPRAVLPIVLSIAGASLLAITVAGCNPSDQAVRADLKLYLQRAADWAPVEAESARTIDRILATQFVDEAEVRRQVTADAPRVDAHLTRIETVQPRSPAVQQIHHHYVETWRTLAKGYQRLLHGLDDGQPSEIAAGRAALEAWRAGIVDTARDLRRLQASVDD
jgi:hypothetical protein